jgi:hypothetical protein
MIFIAQYPMELFYILHKNIPQKKKIFALFSKKKAQDISKFLLQTIKNTNKAIKDTRVLNLFFIEFYDTMYHYIIFRKVKVEKKVVRVLEKLALSSEQVGEKKRKETLKRARKIKV